MPTEDLTITNETGSGDAGLSTESTVDVPVDEPVVTDDDTHTMTPNEDKTLEDSSESGKISASSDKNQLSRDEIDEYLKEIFTEAYDIDLPNLDNESRNILDPYFRQMSEELASQLTKEGINLGDLSKYGISDDELLASLTEVFLEQITLEMLPEPVAFIIRAYDAYLTVQNTQEYLHEYYEIGDQPADTLSKWLDAYKLKTYGDVYSSTGRPEADYLHWIDTYMGGAFGFRTDFGKGWNNFVNKLVHTADTLTYDGIPFAKDYKDEYKMSMYATMSVLSGIIETTDITWSEFNEIFNRNIRELGSVESGEDGNVIVNFELNDDSVVEVFLFTIGSVLATTHFSQTDITNDYLNGLFTLAGGLFRPGVTIQEDDWIRPATLAYFTMGVLSQIFSKNGTAIGNRTAVTKWLADNDIDHFQIPTLIPGRVMIYTPDILGPDFMLVDRAMVGNSKRVAGEVLKTLGKDNILTKLAISAIAYGTTAIDFDFDKDHTDLVAGLLSPVIGSIASSVADNLHDSEAILQATIDDDLLDNINDAVDDGLNFDASSDVDDFVSNYVNDMFQQPDFGIKDVKGISSDLQDKYQQIKKIYDTINQYKDVANEIIEDGLDENTILDDGSDAANDVINAMKATPAFPPSQEDDDDGDTIIGSEGLIQKTYNTDS